MENEKKRSVPIKEWSIDDRPREKLMDKGADALSNAELIAILIVNGSPTRSAVQLARDVMNLTGNNLELLGRLSAKDIRQVKGIGFAKASIIAAALELGRRREGNEFPQKKTFRSSAEIASYFKALFKDKLHEVFVVVYLSQANKMISYKIISTGGITGTVADPRVILKTALEAGATSIILCHNHPSGNLKPSVADEQLTLKVKQAASLIDIRLLDHIIVSNEGYFSFADSGMI